MEDNIATLSSSIGFLAKFTRLLKEAGVTKDQLKSVINNKATRKNLSLYLGLGCPDLTKEILWTCNSTAIRLPAIPESFTPWKYFTETLTDDGVFKKWNISNEFDNDILRISATTDAPLPEVYIFSFDLRVELEESLIRSVLLSEHIFKGTRCASRFCSLISRLDKDGHLPGNGEVSLFFVEIDNKIFIVHVSHPIASLGHQWHISSNLFNPSYHLKWPAGTRVFFAKEYW